MSLHACINTEEAAAGATDNIQGLEQTQRALSGRVILCISDSKRVLERRETILSALGCNVICALEGAKALRSVRRHPVDLALMELRTPGTHGELIVINLKIARPRMPIILVAQDFDEVPLSISHLASRILQQGICSTELLHEIACVVMEQGAHRNVWRFRPELESNLEEVHA